MVGRKASGVSEIAIKAGLPTASRLQIAIFSKIAAEVAKLTRREVPENLQIPAVAGSGKTTTIVAAARLVPPTLRAIFVAFNKKIVTELEARLPPHVPAKTMNAFGYKTIGRFIQGARRGGFPQMEFGKISRIMRQIMSKEAAKEYGEDVRFLVGKARAFGVVPERLVGRGYDNANGCVDTMEFWSDLADHYGLTINGDKFQMVVRFVREILYEDITQDSTLDFDDQLYLTVITRVGKNHIPCEKFDVVFTDEGQDLNPVQRVLLSMMMKDGAFLTVVGDKRQSIYGFRGADSESMDKLKAEFKMAELPLSITYRCGKKIVERARTVFAEIEAAENAADGEVVTYDKYKAAILRPGDLVICRNNAPLVKFAYKLIVRRIPVKVLGRDIGADLVRLIDKLPHDNEVVKLAEELVKWRDEQTEIVRRKDPDDEAGVERINDRFDTIMVFVQESHSATVEDIKRTIQDLFADTKDDSKVVLSTIHKAKGAEAERVFFLDAHLMYPRWVQPDSWQYDQERNLEYVAITRAKLHLGYIQTDFLED